MHNQSKPSRLQYVSRECSRKSHERDQVACTHMLHVAQFYRFVFVRRKSVYIVPVKSSGTIKDLAFSSIGSMHRTIAFKEGQCLVNVQNRPRPRQAAQAAQTKFWDNLDQKLKSGGAAVVMGAALSLCQPAFAELNKYEAAAGGSGANSLL